MEKHLFLPVLSRIFIHVITCLCSLILSLFSLVPFSFCHFLSFFLSHYHFAPSFILGVKYSVCFIFFFFTLFSLHSSDTIGEKKMCLGHRYYLFLFFLFAPSLTLERNFGICFQEITRLAIFTIVHTCGRALNVHFSM